MDAMELIRHQHRAEREEQAAHAELEIVKHALALREIARQQEGGGVSS